MVTYKGNIVLEVLQNWGYNKGEFEEIVVRLARKPYYVKSATAKYNALDNYISYELDLSEKGKRLKKARERIGMTQEGVILALAEIGITCSKSYISQLERGTRKNPNLDILLGLSYIYNVNIAELLKLDI